MKTDHIVEAASIKETGEAPFQAKFTLQELLDATGGEFVASSKEAVKPNADLKYGVSTDTRTIGPGHWFIPLSGASFNGHNFVAQAIGQGAAGAIVARREWEQRQQEWTGLSELILVDEPLNAYLAIARWHRLHHTHANLKVVALTGSSGKTTTKEMLYAAFSVVRKTQKTLKNFNNEVGVSQTLLAIEPNTEIAIVEMGMRGLNQIDILSLAALPDLAIINNIGPAHIELLGSLDNVAKAKLEIVQGLKSDAGILVTNGDDPLLKQWTPEYWKPGDLKRQWRTFQLADAQQVETSADGVAFTYKNSLKVRLPIPGLHNVQNALAVLTAGEILGLPLEKLAKGLAAFQPEGGRWEKQAIPGYENLWVINDAYNANPDSCRASLTTFFEMPTPGLKRILVLAGMKELGPFSQQYHRELADFLIERQRTAQFPLDILIAVGEEVRDILPGIQNNFAACPVFHVDSGEQLSALIPEKSLPMENALYFLKGSRFYKLEQWATALKT